MIFQKQATLVLRLYQKTADQKLEWKPAVKEGVFQVSFSDYSVQLSEVDRGGTTDYRIEVFNSDGEIADGFTDVDISDEPGAPVNTKARVDQPSRPSWFKTMKELHEMARRSALGADKAIDSLLADLDRE